ncbi:MAG: hypothetical protein ACI808_003132 [Paraglaciecola sp.]|jgi:hypothetical protein
MCHGAYLTWSCLMENISDSLVFLDALFEDSATMRNLRQQGPLISGIDTPQ